MAERRTREDGRVKLAKNEGALVDLIRILSEGRMLTAVQIAAQTGCSKPVAHDRLRTLRKRGVPFQTIRVREGITGPKSVAYAIVEE